MPPYTPKGTFGGNRRRRVPFAAAAALAALALTATQAQAAGVVAAAPYDEASQPTLVSKDPAGFGDARASAAADAASGRLDGTTWAYGRAAPGGQRLYNYEGAGYNYAYGGAFVVDRIPVTGPGSFRVTVRVSVPEYRNVARTDPSPVPEHGTTFAPNQAFADQIAHAVLWLHRCAPPADCFSASYEAGEIKTTAAWIANTAYPWVDVRQGEALLLRECLTSSHPGAGQVRARVGIEARAVVSGSGEAESVFDGASVTDVAVEPVASCP